MGAATSFNNPFDGIININSAAGSADEFFNATGGSEAFSRQVPSRISKKSKVEVEDNHNSGTNDGKKNIAALCVERKDQGVIISQEFKVAQT